MAVSSYVIAAICGCWYRESGCNPGIYESLVVTPPDAVWGEYGANTGGFGLGQWTNTQGDHHGRRYQLAMWLSGAGFQPDDGAGQIAFMIHEDVWYYTSVIRTGARTLTEFLNSESTNLNDLVWDFLAGWEGVPGDAFQIRLEHAQTAFQYIQEHATDSPSDYQWIKGNFYMSDAQWLNNVMCVYFAMNGYVPPTPPEPTDEKKMPIWMYLRLF